MCAKEQHRTRNKEKLQKNVPAALCSRLFVAFRFEKSEFHTLPCCIAGDTGADGGKC